MPTPLIIPTINPQVPKVNPQVPTMYPKVAKVMTVNPQVPTMYPKVAKVMTMYPKVMTMYPQVSTMYPQVSTMYPQVPKVNPQVSTMYPQVPKVNPQVPTVMPTVNPKVNPKGVGVQDADDRVPEGDLRDFFKEVYRLSAPFLAVSPESEPYMARHTGNLTYSLSAHLKHAGPLRAAQENAVKTTSPLYAG